MTSILARIALPTAKANVLSMCARSARVGIFVGTTGLFGAHLFVKPALITTQCQGIKFPNQN